MVVIADAATGMERRIFSLPGHQYHRPVFTADGTRLICQRQREETYDTEWRVTLVSLDPVSGEETDLLPDFDNWPWPGRAIASPVAGDATLWFTGDERATVRSSAVTRTARSPASPLPARTPPSA